MTYSPEPLNGYMVRMIVAFINSILPPVFHSDHLEQSILKPWDKLNTLMYKIIIYLNSTH